MSAPTREEVDVALLALLTALKTSGDAKTVRRTLEAFSQAAPELQPALYIADGPEDPETGKGWPPLWTFHYLVTIYVNRKGRGAQKNPETPDTGMNAILEKVRNWLPPSKLTGWQDLGGLVGRAWIDGTIERFPGSQADQALATVPVAVKLKGDNYLGGGNFWFDVGTLYLVPRKKREGLAYTDETRMRVGTLRDVSLGFSSVIEPRRASAGQYPIGAQHKSSEAIGRFSFGKFDGEMISKFLFGLDPTPQAFLLKQDEELVVPITNTITPVPPDGGIFSEDLGIYRGADGVPGEDFEPMERVAADPNNSQYSEAGGVYTFADDGSEQDRKMLISYRYQVVGGRRVVIGNPPPYDVPTFELDLLGEYNGKQLLITLGSVAVSQVLFRSTVEVFNVADCEFQALEDDDGNVGTLNLG